MYSYVDVITSRANNKHVNLWKYNNEKKMCIEFPSFTEYFHIFYLIWDLQIHEADIIFTMCI